MCSREENFCLSKTVPDRPPKEGNRQNKAAEEPPSYGNRVYPQYESRPPYPPGSNPCLHQPCPPRSQDSFRNKRQNPPMQPEEMMGYMPCGTIGEAAAQDRSPQYGPCGRIPPPKPIWPCEVQRQPCKKPPPPEEEAEDAEPKAEGEEGDEEQPPAEGEGEEGEEGEDAKPAEGVCVPCEEPEEFPCGRIPGEPIKEECKYRPQKALPSTRPSRQKIGYLPCGEKPPEYPQKICAMFDPERKILPLPFDPETSTPIRLARKICADLAAAKTDEPEQEEEYCPPPPEPPGDAAMTGNFNAEVVIVEEFIPRPEPTYPAYPVYDCEKEQTERIAELEPILYTPCYEKFVSQGYTRDR